MGIEIKPAQEAKIDNLAAATGRVKADILEEVIESYFYELEGVRELLDGRYDDIKSGRVKPLAGEEVFERLRRKSAERRTPRS
jgi:predicted DNA-binding protein